MVDRITAQRLRFRTVFKLITIGNLFFFLPFSLLSGVLSLFGWSTVEWTVNRLRE